MANVFRFFLALAGLPLAWGLTAVFLDEFRLLAMGEGGGFPVGTCALLVGFVVCLVVLMIFPLPIRLYVFGHEPTHAVWGLLFGAKVSNLRVGLRGGSVELTKSNVLITLSPYFCPFYTILVISLALIVQAFVSPLPGKGVWLFAIGATWCFHVVFTLRALFQRQPDVEEYGHLFSYVFIWCFSLLGIVIALVCTTESTWGQLGGFFATRVGQAYGAVGYGGRWLYESVRSLSVLQG